jgi:hypothetical protein
MAYTKFQAIEDAIKTLTKMVSAGTWPPKKMPPKEEIVGVFVGKTAYFQNHKKVFTNIHQYSAMEKWLAQADDAPLDITVWGDMKPTFDNLKKILDFHARRSGKKGNDLFSPQKKGKKKHRDGPSSDSEKVDKKGKGEQRDDSPDSEKVDKKGKGKQQDDSSDSEKVDKKGKGKKSAGGGKKASSSKSCY